MSDDISPKEWETLSAYLDGQLSRKEQERLEISLNQNPAMHEALEGLRHTRILLRNQPKIRASRNFTLTQEMAGVQRERLKPGFALPVLKTVSVMASILFVLIFAGDLLTSGSSISPSSMVSAPEQESILMEKAAPQLAVPEEAMESIEEGRVDGTSSFEMDQGEAAADYEIEPPARMLETMPQVSGDSEEVGGDAFIPDAAEESAAVEPNILQKTLIRESTLRILEVFLIAVAITAGIAVIYINRRSQDREM